MSMLIAGVGELMGKLGGRSIHDVVVSVGVFRVGFLLEAKNGMQSYGVCEQEQGVGRGG